MSNFPKNFFWGASTSSHQVEGNLVNSWTEWEKEYSVEKSEECKKQRPWNLKHDDVNYKLACTKENYLSGVGCDSFNRYKEDVNALKDMNLNAYRFSIEWSRIEPKKGEFSKEGIEYYQKLISELKEKGIEPFVTCWHWTLPLWLRDEGGMLSKNIDEYWERYIQYLVDNLGDIVKYWIPINEPFVYTGMSYFAGIWPPQRKNGFEFVKIGFLTLPRLHKIAYRVIKEKSNKNIVSIAKNNAYNESYDSKIWNVLAKKVVNFFSNDLFILMIRKQLDCIGLNYYFKNRVTIFGNRNDNDRISDYGWWMVPSGIYDALMALKKFKMPVFVFENGLADREDKYRKWWLDETFKALEKSIGDGLDLRGYFHWSLIDNFEWADGFWPKFGLVDMDRKVKDSGKYYSDLILRIRNN